MKKGDRVRIIRSDPDSFLRYGDRATVDYVLPSYDKIICVLDEARGSHTSCCLYGFEEHEHWECIS